MSKTVMFSYLETGVKTITAYLVMFIITSKLGVEKYGLYMLIIYTVGFVEKFLGTRTGEVLASFLSKTSIKTRKNIFFKALIIDTVMACIIFLFVLFLQDILARIFLKTDSSNNILLLYSCVPVFAILRQSFIGLLIEKNKLVYINFSEIISDVCKILLILFHFQSLSLSVIIQSCALAAIISFMIVLIMSHKYVFFIMKQKNVLDKHVTKKFYGYMWKSYASYTLKAFTRNIDGLIIGALLNPLLLGEYEIVKKVTNVVRTLIMPFVKVHFPKMIESFSESYDALLIKINAISKKIILIFSFAVAIDLVAIIVYFVTFAEINITSRIVLMVVLFLINHFLSIMMWWTSYYSTIVNPVYGFKAQLIYLTCIIPTMLLFTYYGSAQGALLSKIFINVVLVIYWRKVKIRDKVRFDLNENSNDCSKISY